MRPIVIIGAARSGTKIVRDSLAVATAAGAVPYDVGFVWRYGNEKHPDDCLRVEDVRPKTLDMVRGYLNKYANADGLVIEKTVGNTLRVPYVARILPDAAFVHLIRDGVNVTESTWREWHAPSKLSYLRAKVRHFPFRMVPTYGRKFLLAQTVGRMRPGGAASTWGPRYPGIDQDVDHHDIWRVCARQWRAAVTAARRDLAVVSNPVIELRFEDLITDPRNALEVLVESLGLPTSATHLDQAASMINPGVARSARGKISEEQRSVLEVEIGELLEELGYEQP